MVVEKEIEDGVKFSMPSSPDLFTVGRMVRIHKPVAICLCLGHRYHVSFSYMLTRAYVETEMQHETGASMLHLEVLEIFGST